jgi:hypothetical protein
LSPSLFNALRRPSRLRVAATWLCLLACTLQSFVAQTHVHVPGAQAPLSAASYDRLDAGAAALWTAADSDEDDSPKHGGREGSSPCPLCQIVLHGGAAPAPSFAFSLPLPIAIAVTEHEQTPSGAFVAISFNWQGRAPPLA